MWHVVSARQIAVLLSALTIISAHKQAKTEEEREVLRGLQVAAYHASVSRKTVAIL